MIVPFLGGLVWIAVSRGLAPIHGVAAQLAGRGADLLAPVLDHGLPEEIRPLTHAVNDLLAKLERAAGIQRIFIADAAHELRTPLTALKLQVALAERADDAAMRNEAFTALHAGLERASRLVQQLLTLARHEPGATQQGMKKVDMAEIVSAAVADLAPQADARRIDLGITSAVPALVDGDPDALRILINNLLDNALHATPDGSRVDVAVDCTADKVVVTVDDSGPGIAALELTRVFDRFYRGRDASAGGSGLGLAIVRRIADLHQGQVTLVNTDTGLRASLQLPLMQTPQRYV